MNKEQITKLALANGFKLKEQPDGTLALNPYVFDFVKAVLEKLAEEQEPVAHQSITDPSEIVEASQRDPMWDGPIRPLYSHPAPAQPYDQQALELCEACGWKTLIPPDECLNCERKPVQSAGLLAALKRAHAWMENQSDAQSKGGHATFDLMMLREERDAISDTLKAMNPAPAQPACDATIARIMSKVQCFASTWALVGTRFDSGDMLQQAEDERAEIEAAVRSLPRR